MQHLVRLHRYALHPAAHLRHNRHGTKHLVTNVGIREVVVHPEDHRANQGDTAEHRRRYGPLIERDAEDFKHHDAQRGVGQ